MNLKNKTKNKLFSLKYIVAAILDELSNNV